MKKCILCFIFLLLLVSCNDSVLLKECNNNLSSFKEKIYLNNTVEVKYSLDVLCNDDSLYNYNILSKIAIDQCYIDLIAEEQPSKLIIDNDIFYTVFKVDDKYVVEDLGSVDFLKTLNIYPDYDYLFNISNSILKGVKYENNYYNINCYLSKYFDFVSNGIVKGVYDAIEKESIKSSDLNINIEFINDNTLKMEYFYDIIVCVDDEINKFHITESYQFKIIEFKDYVSLDDCYISLSSYLSSSMYSIDNDITKFNKFYIDSDEGYALISFSDDDYEFSVSNDNVIIYLYDKNYKKIDNFDYTNFSMDSGEYYIYFKCNEDCFITLTKK